MERARNINTNATETIKKSRGRPKHIEQKAQPQEQNNNNLNNVSNKDILNLQDKLIKLKKAEA